MDDLAYNGKLTTFLYSLADFFMPQSSQELRHAVVEGSPAITAQWVASFTHVSVNPNVEQNYDNAEMLGDQVMSLNFVYFLRKIYRGIDESQLSELKVAYLQTNLQAALSRQLNLPHYLRAADPALREMESVQEDLLEAFFGTLFSVGNDALGPMYGNLLAYNLLVALYHDKIDIERSYGNVRTQVKEIVEKLPGAESGSIRSMIKVRDLGERGFLTTITLPAAVMQWIRRSPPRPQGGQKFDIDLFNPQIASAEGATKAESENRAFDQALATLKSIFPTEIIYAYGRLLAIDPTLRERLYDKIRAMGFREVEISRAADRMPFLQIVGLRGDGSKEILITRSKESLPGDTTAKKQIALVEEFVRSEAPR